MNKNLIVREEGGIFFLFDGDQKRLSPIQLPIGTTDVEFAKAIAEDNAISYLNGKDDDALRSLLLADYKALADQDPFTWGPIEKEDYDDDEYDQEKQERIEMSIELLQENIIGWSREQLITFLDAHSKYGSLGFVEQIGYGAIHDMDDDLDMQTYEFSTDLEDCLACSREDDVDIMDAINVALSEFGYFLSPDIKQQLEDLHII